MSDDDTSMGGTARALKRLRTHSSPSLNADPKVTSQDTPGNNDDDSSSDDGFGPSLPPAPGAVRKKRKILPHALEKQYLEALPTSPRYSKSLMHRDNLAFVTMTPITDFLITTSIDGVVKFWKKMATGIEFVKMFRAHQGEIVSVSVSSDGRSFASAGADRKVVIFDVVTFDLLATLTLEHPPRVICWIHHRGAPLPILAVAETHRPVISIYDGRGGNPTPMHTVRNLHRSVVHLMTFNDKYKCVVSCDESGMVEYWSPRPEHDFEKPDAVFEYKSGTGLFEFKKSKSVPASLTMSPTQESFATFSYPDRMIRVFDFPTGKLTRTYDESLTTLTTLQQASSSANKLADIEFGRRMALESSLDLAALQKANIIFDETGNFIMFGTLAGIKVLNLSSNKIVRTLGRDEALRPMHLAVYQGAPSKKGVVTVEMAASANPLLEEAQARDPMVFCTAAQKSRFYMFTNETPVSKADRDIVNENPLKEGAAAGSSKALERRPGDTGAAAILHTSMGDIHLRLFPEAAPKTVENFVTHARNGYYNGTIFHRVVKKFMIQGGDPVGDGTGGESIWGGEFEDEFGSLRHDKPYTLSSANYGPNTNGSQFFITTEKTPWLDNKHTIFGRATQGLDVIHKIENVRTYKDKPEDDIKIISISVL